LENDYRLAIKQLVNQYNNGEIDFERYKEKRRKIIDFMDDDYNGTIINNVKTDNNISISKN
jgi:hypothetical protein